MRAAFSASSCLNCCVLLFTLAPEFDFLITTGDWTTMKYCVVFFVLLIGQCSIAHGQGEGISSNYEQAMTALTNSEQPPFIQLTNPANYLNLTPVPSTPLVGIDPALWPQYEIPIFPPSPLNTVSLPPTPPGNGLSEEKAALLLAELAWELKGKDATISAISGAMGQDPKAFFENMWAQHAPLIVGTGAFYFAGPEIVTDFNSEFLDPAGLGIAPGKKLKFRLPEFPVFSGHINGGTFIHVGIIPELGVTTPSSTDPDGDSTFKSYFVITY